MLLPRAKKQYPIVCFGTARSTNHMQRAIVVVIAAAKPALDSARTWLFMVFGVTTSTGGVTHGEA